MREKKFFENYCSLVENKEKLSIIELDAFDKLSLDLDSKIKDEVKRKKTTHGIEVNTFLYPLKGIGLTLDEFIGILCNISNEFEKLGYEVFMEDRQKEINKMAYYAYNKQWLNKIILIIK